jgi:RecA/RadA recombinase
LDILPLYSISLFSLTETCLFVAFWRTLRGRFICGWGGFTSDFLSGLLGVKRLWVAIIKEQRRNTAAVAETISAREALERLAAFPTFTSGSPSFDKMLDGGFRAGRVVEVYGSSGCGKSLLAMQTALQVAATKEMAIFIDTEGAFRPERLQMMARARGERSEGLLDRIEYVRVTTAAAQLDAVRAISQRSETSAARFVAIDTFTRNFTLDYPGHSNLASRQGGLDVLLSEIARDAFIHGRAYLLTNRVTFSQSDGEARIGGRTMEQLVHCSIHLEKTKDGVKATRTSDRVSAQLGQIGEAGLS